jgi:hypothetical protein
MFEINKKILKKFHMYDNVIISHMDINKEFTLGYISNIALNCVGEIVFEVTTSKYDTELCKSYQIVATYHPSRLSKIF